MTEDTEARAGHQKIESIVVGNIVVDIWEKRMESNRVFYDVSISRRYYINDEIRYSSKIQQRDFGDLVLAVLDARSAVQDYMYDAEKARREQESE